MFLTSATSGRRGGVKHSSHAGGTARAKVGSAPVPLSALAHDELPTTLTTILFGGPTSAAVGKGSPEHFSDADAVLLGLERPRGLPGGLPAQMSHQRT